MFKTKRKFPNDWSNLNDEQVLENIRYLLEYYKNYDLIPGDEDCVFVGNVYISKTEIESKDSKDVFYINRRYYPDRDNSLQELLDKCKKEIEIQEPIRKQKDKKLLSREKRKDWWINNFNLVFACVVASFVLVVVIKELLHEHNVDKHEKQINKLVQKYEEKFPNWNDTIRLATTDEELARAINKREQIQQKIANYRDSLERSGM